MANFEDDQIRSMKSKLEQIELITSFIDPRLNTIVSWEKNAPESHLIALQNHKSFETFIPLGLSRNTWSLI
jgi:hypothetical protein